MGADMNKQISILTSLLIVAGSLAVAAGGCELIASVDRSLIPGGGGAGGTGGATSGSTTTTTTTSSTGGTGGTAPVCDGGTACQVDTDCASLASACVSATCPSGCCVTADIAKGTTCTGGTGDKVCDGNGSCVACNADTDCAAATCSGSTFTPAETCSAAHVCVAGGSPQTC